MRYTELVSVLVFCASGTAAADSLAAKGADHWAYKPAQTVAPPDVPGTQNPIDAFIAAGLQPQGLAMAGRAEPRALIRRVYYDLTGLPPTPEEVEEFVQDPSEAAYERMVERLLASPHYGEKWGRFWLDLVRYADSNGYERDSDKPFMWRYRDYVVDSFNQDKPYDQFICEQLAGDELEEVTPESITATGFHRLHVWDDEPADPEQARYDNLDDVASTTAQVFLGMSIGCARCHDSKIDPIPQKDYYRFLAFFENVTPITREQLTRSIMTAPEQAEHDRLQLEKSKKVDAIREDMFVTEAAIYASVAETLSDAPDHVSDLMDLSFRFYRDTWDALPDFEMLRPETAGPVDHNFITLAPATRQEGIGLVYDARLFVPAQGEYSFHVDAKDGVRLVVGGAEVMKADGVGPHQADAQATLAKGFTSFRLEFFNKADRPSLAVSWSGPGFATRALSVSAEETGAIPMAKVLEAHAASIDSKQLELHTALKQALEHAHAAQIPGKFATTVAEFGAAAPKTFVHVRGNAHVHGEEVTPGFPQILGALESPLSGETPLPPLSALESHVSGETPPSPLGATTGRRRALAEWIVDPGNPLTARVMVNRIWQGHFGRGIVGTPSEFGLQADEPTHPELLDWLARWFVEHEWRIKPLHKLIVMSNTYRSAARPDPRAIEADPENRLLSRFPMRRLTAEEVRDSMLAVAGTLNGAVGGPGFFLQLPQEVLATSSMASAIWHESSPDDQRRRTLYIHTKRSLLAPLLTDFDLADTDNSCPVRFATTQPTQALTMLNSEYVNTQAHALAARLRAEEQDVEAQARRGWHLVTGRPAEASEVERSMALMRTLRDEHQVSADQALDRFCLVLLNLNEFIFLD